MEIPMLLRDTCTVRSCWPVYYLLEALLVNSCGCHPNMNKGLFFYVFKNAATEAWGLDSFCFCANFAVTDFLKAALRMSEASFRSLPRVEYSPGRTILYMLTESWCNPVQFVMSHFLQRCFRFTPLYLIS